VSLALVAFFAVGVVASKEKSLALITFTAMPALDTISNSLYLLQTRFYNPLFFSLVVVFHFTQNWVWVLQMYKLGALLPGYLFAPPTFMTNGTLLWLGRDLGDGPQTFVSCLGWPSCYGKRLSCTYPLHDTLTKLFVYWIVWIGCFFVQLGSALLLVMLYTPIYAFHIPFWTIWALIGVYVNHVKAMAIGKVWNLWFYVWLGIDKARYERVESSCFIDTGIMNSSLFVGMNTHIDTNI